MWRRTALDIAGAKPDPLPVLLLLLSVAAFTGCGRGGGDSLEQGLSLYRQNRLEDALPLLEQAVAARENDAEAHAWLAETYRRLRAPDKAAELARKAIDLDPCSSFAHTVLAWNYNPMYGMWAGVNSEMAWVHLMKAAECDSTDGNIWPGAWTEAMRRGDRVSERKALRIMLRTGFFTQPLLAYNRWMLRYLPENALLLTNGDWDTYPAVALQQEEAFRPDVAVVNRSLLNTPWYAQYVRERHGIPLAYSDEELYALKPYVDSQGRTVFVSEQMLQGWLDMAASDSLSRPIAVSVTVDPTDLIPGLEDHLVLAGAFWLWQPVAASSPQDTALISTSLAGIDPKDFAGSFVSPQDRSPVRMTSGNLLVHNVSAAALKYAITLLEAKRPSEAGKIISWLEEFESGTELGPVSETHIAELRKEIEGL